MEKTKRDILEGLNAAQAEAVQCTEGPSLIIAGAGSGKTKVLTCRIAYLIENGAAPSQVLALTFTKKAAGEMKERIAALIGEKRARWIWMGTFHSVFIRFLREYAELLGYPQQFTIYDQSDSRSVVKQCIKELELDDKVYKPVNVLNRISMAKNSLVTVNGYKANPELAEEDRMARKPRTADIYALYSQKCKEAGAMDFDDILLNTNILFRDHPEALENIASRFTHILVDEYQDTNYAQYLILRKLAAKHRNISVVGDDSQSIYSFRGARIENILRFQKDYTEAKVFRLEQNYRSTQTIVNAANSLIAKNEHRLKKECFSKADIGEKVHLLKAFTDQEEAYLTASAIVERIYADKAQYSDFAILYRTNAQSRSFEESLRRKNLPYRIYGGHSFYEREEIKDLIAYFKLVVNPQDNEAFRRIINKPARGIGDTTIEHLSAAANAAGCALLQAVELPAEKLAAAGLRDAAVHKLQDFANLMRPLIAKSTTEDAFNLALEVGNASGYLVSLKADSDPETQARYENTEELFNGLKQYVEEETEMRRELADDNPEEAGSTVTLSDYLENISLLSEAEKDDLTDGSDNANRITLMTVHAAKGLEFPYVFVAGMEENLFPSENMNGSLSEIEEERRLFYVAITRAEKAVTLSYARSRMKWGKTESNPPSRFLREIDSRYIDGEIEDEGPKSISGGFGQQSISTGFERSGRPVYVRNAAASQRPAQRQDQRPVQQPARPSAPTFTRTVQHAPDPNFKPDPISELRPGQRVEHDRFGFGTILSFEDQGANMKAVVKFDEAGQKTLLLKFAKLRIDR